MSSLWVYLSVSVLMLTGVLLIFIILLQRGRGGGLAGAFGGAGGQSALGTKAGDVFTKITVVLAMIWVFVACLSIYALRYQSNAWAAELPDSVESAAPEPKVDEAGGGAGVFPDGPALPRNTDGAGATLPGETKGTRLPSEASDGQGDASSDGAAKDLPPANPTPPADETTP